MTAAQKAAATADQAAVTVYVARVETRHFEFTGYGRTEKEARAAIEQVWRDHCRQYPAEPELWKTLREEIWVTAFKTGCGYRDNENVVVR